MLRGGGCGIASAEWCYFGSHANVIRQTHFYLRNMTSADSPVSHQWNSVVPRGTIRLLHNSVKLQRRWRGRADSEEISCSYFPFPPPWW